MQHVFSAASLNGTVASWLQAIELGHASSRPFLGMLVIAVCYCRTHMAMTAPQAA